MRFIFTEIELAGVQLPIEGYAEFEHDPRYARRAMPTIVLHGYEPGSRRPIDAHLMLSPSRMPADATAVAAGCLWSLNIAIREYLMTKCFEALCRQWDEEAAGRLEAAHWRAHEERFDGYSVA
jgi:hypothetical protein